MKIAELGEFGLIELIADIVSKSRDTKSTSWQKLIIGIGDDATVWKDDEHIHLATTDSLIQDIHFDLIITSWEDIGWKAMAANLSDVAAMGGSAKYALVSLALPGELETNCIINLYHGMINIASQFDVAVVGGNITSADKVNINITIFGSLKGKTMLTRSAAMPGEQIAITGYTGISAAGLQMLRHQLIFNPEAAEFLKLAYRRPTPKIKEGQALLYHGVRAAIDISDGLIGDLTHICQASKVGARIMENQLPIHPTIKANFTSDWQQLVLNGGEDYELLFTAKSQVMAKLQNSFVSPITVIGEVTEEMAGQVTLLDTAGKSIHWHETGWEHFKSNSRA